MREGAKEGIPENARILIIKTHAIGDLLLTTPAIRDLRSAFPSAHITLLVGSWSASVVRGNPALDEIIEVEDSVFLKKKIFPLLRLLLKLRSRRFDAAFIFHPLPAIHLFAKLAGIPLRYGLTRPGGSPYLTKGVEEDLGDGVYYAENFQRVVALAGAKTGSVLLEAVARPEGDGAVALVLGEHGISPEDEILLVAPGGGRNSKDNVEAKRWPRERFEAVLREIAGRRPALKMVLCGSAGDRPETDYLAARIPGITDLTGKFALGELTSLVRRSEAVFCNDSAILHIGVANGIPVVAVFGPTSRGRFLPEGARDTSIQATTVCSPCYVGGGFPGCTIGYQCMKDVTPEQVLARLDSALDLRKKPA